MPAINLTNNTDLNLNASSDDQNATLNRYLGSLLTFKTPPSFDAITNQPLKDQNDSGFPIEVTAAGEGKFALEKTTLNVRPGATSSIGLAHGDDESDFLASLKTDPRPDSSGLVSFALKGSLTVGDTASAGDVTFGISNNASLTLTSYYAAEASETLGSAVEKAITGLTIPHDLQDLKSIPAGRICELQAQGSIKFSASVTYDFLNDPLAAVAIAKLPPLSVSASGSATIEAEAAHTSAHKLTAAKLESGVVHLALTFSNTDDFETALSVSAGVGVSIGGQDPIAFLLGRLNPNAAAQADAIAAQMKDAAQFKSDIRSAIDEALTTSLAVSLRAELEKSHTTKRVFLYEIDLAAVEANADSRDAVQAALRGDFTAMTKQGAPLAGIRELHSVLTNISATTHKFALHLLGLFNASSVEQFVARSTVDFTKDTHELVLSDRTVEVLESNLNAEKLRKVVLKDITLTLPASANTPEAKTPVTLAFVDREASTKPARLRQFANALGAVGAPQAAAAQGLLARHLDDNGVCSLFLGLSLTAAQTKQLFIGDDGKARSFAAYIRRYCEAERALLAGLEHDPEINFRLILFNAGIDVWNDLHDKGAAAAMLPVLRDLGLPDAQAQLAVTDAITGIWWADAMADYAQALVKHQPLEKVGKEVVKGANQGYNEPWMLLAARDLAGNPEVQAQFSSSVAQPAPLSAASGS